MQTEHWTNWSPDCAKCKRLIPPLPQYHCSLQLVDRKDCYSLPEPKKKSTRTIQNFLLMSIAPFPYYNNYGKQYLDLPDSRRSRHHHHQQCDPILLLRYNDRSHCPAFPPSTIVMNRSPAPGIQFRLYLSRYSVRSS